jgi:hypothetical protein
MLTERRAEESGFCFFIFIILMREKEATIKFGAQPKISLEEKQPATVRAGRFFSAKLRYE